MFKYLWTYLFNQEITLPQPFTHFSISKPPNSTWKTQFSTLGLHSQHITWPPLHSNNMIIPKTNRIQPFHQGTIFTKGGMGPFWNLTFEIKPLKLSYTCRISKISPTFAKFNKNTPNLKCMKVNSLCYNSQFKPYQDGAYIGHKILWNITVQKKNSKTLREICTLLIQNFNNLHHQPIQRVFHIFYTFHLLNQLLQLPKLTFEMTWPFVFHKNAILQLFFAWHLFTTFCNFAKLTQMTPLIT